MRTTGYYRGDHLLQTLTRHARYSRRNQHHRNILSFFRTEYFVHLPYEDDRHLLLQHAMESLDYWNVSKTPPKNLIHYLLTIVVSGFPNPIPTSFLPARYSLLPE
jgi:hypothetical protein